jgi:hypothetical protein
MLKAFQNPFGAQGQEWSFRQGNIVNKAVPNALGNASRPDNATQGRIV